MVILYMQSSSKSVTLKYEAVSLLYTLYSLVRVLTQTVRGAGSSPTQSYILFIVALVVY